MATKSIRLSDGTDTLLPESAVMGSNSVGYYTKCADGTLIQWGQKQKSISFTSQWGALYFGDGDLVTFPISFVDTPAISVNHYSGSSAFVITLGGSPNGITRLQFARMVSGTETITYTWLAIGRWK